jgi:hypothetical protein
MLVIEGYFEKGHFIPDQPVVIPEKIKALMILDKKEDQKTEGENKKQERIRKWRQFGEAILNCDEELTGSPQRLKFRTPEEIALL